MKAIWSKKLAAVAMALVLLAGMLPVGVSAMSGCTDGLHLPGDTLYPANWNSETGGYGHDYYLCTVCGGACNANGGSEVFVGPENGCSGGYKCHVPDLDAPYVTACSGNTGFYYCKACKKIVDADGTVADVSTLGGHTPGDSLKPADYKPCVGGHQSAYYICTVCEAACEADGSAAPYTRGTGVHRPGTTLYPADWNSTNGGYVVEHYLCEDCGWGCDAVGNAEMFVGPGDECAVGKHSPGTEWHEADYTPCNGGYKSGWYECSECHQPCDADGKAIEWEPGTGTHTRGTEKHEPNYTTCNGGVKSEWYECDLCHQPCDVDGKTLEWEPGTGEHTRGTEEFPADYTPCFGGFRTPHYECVDCHCPLDAEGNVMEPEAGTGTHTPGTEEFPADYTPCFGGYRTAHYECEICHCSLDAEGNVIDWEPGTGEHTRGTEEFPADYTPCFGGFRTVHYECEVCHCALDAEGNMMDWEPGTGEHTRGTEEFPADYTPCFGGFRTTHYECVDCHCPLDAEGNVMEPEEGTGAHTPGTEKHEPDYTPCNGGFVDEWYECEACHQPCAADGGEAAWEEAKEGHRIVEVPEKAPTYESEGNWAYWECEVCHSMYRDAEGTEVIENWDEIVRPKLEPEESSSMETTIKEGLNEVPEAVAKQYPTVEDILKALLEKAFSGNAAMKEENTGRLLLDVALQMRTAGGELIPVDPENFPEEGVEVLLPYPEGTDRSYTFVITHMITSGECAGEIEVLSYRAERDGLRVRFTSMSPVCITYLVKQPAEVTVTVPVANPTTGAGSTMLPMAVLCGGALTVLLAVKRKER